jgi:hypothetical protein
LTDENIYYLLPLVYTCEYVYIYHALFIRKSLLLLLCCHTKRVSGIHSGLGYPWVWFWGWIITRIGVRCGFGFRVRVYRDSTRSESAPLPSLALIVSYPARLANLSFSKCSTYQGTQLLVGPPPRCRAWYSWNHWTSLTTASQGTSLRARCLLLFLRSSTFLRAPPMEANTLLSF